MARARNIKPGFFSNDSLGECKPETRLLFIGLWTLADREGRLHDRARKFKAELFPYDSIDCEPMLEELASQKLIERYEVDGQRYISIPNFLKHQSPHHLEKPSIIPANNGSLRQVSDKSQTGTDLGAYQSPLNPESGILNPESGMRNPESSNLVQAPDPLPPVLPQKHLSDERFRTKWAEWKSKLARNNGKLLDIWAEKQNLEKLERLTTDEAYELVAYCVGLTKCNNLIWDGSHRRSREPPGKNLKHRMTDEELFSKVGT